MLLAVDANILVSELRSARGREIIRRPDLKLYIAEEPWAEAQEHLARRLKEVVAQGRIDQPNAQLLLSTALTTARDVVRLVPRSTYERNEASARVRIPRDADDWPTVAVALALDADIWTLDGHYLGCGRATWTTETLRTELRRPYMPQWTYAVVVLSRVPGQPVWLAASEGEAPPGIPNPVTSPWDVLPVMGRDDWELVNLTRTSRTRSIGEVETLDLVFKKRA